MTSSEDLLRQARDMTTARPGKVPSRRLAVVTCMDTRIDPLRLFDAGPGEIHTIENAGGIVTDDVIRSVLVSQRQLGTRSVAVVMHTDCGLLGLDDEAESAAIAADTGVRLPFSLGGFDDLQTELTESIHRLRNNPLIPHTNMIRGYIFDVETKTLREVPIA